MQKFLSYKGYLIKASSKKIAESEKWVSELCIGKSFESQVPAREFSSANQWDSEQEAIDNCVMFGKQIVDGEHPELELPE
jgi:hypothetical protein